MFADFFSSDKVHALETNLLPRQTSRIELLAKILNNFNGIKLEIWLLNVISVNIHSSKYWQSLKQRFKTGNPKTRTQKIVTLNTGTPKLECLKPGPGHQKMVTTTFFNISLYVSLFSQCELIYVCVSVLYQTKSCFSKLNADLFSRIRSSNYRLILPIFYSF